MPVDVVLSDLSKFTTKDRDIDCEQQWSFCLDTLRIANLILKTGGTALIKMYLGMEEPRYFVRVI
jgi:23S rRNA U2552 (ribose-2'-O)-methylase RlmE/FtsJ